MRNKCIAILLLLTTLSAHAQLTLDSCLMIARQNSVAMQRAEISKERAHQVRMQALTKYFPQVQATAVGFHALHPVIDVGIDDLSNASVRDLLLTLYGNYGAALGLENTFSLFRHGVLAGVSAIQPVYMGGKIVAGNQLAQLGEQAASLQADITERDLLEQVEECYWLVVGLEQKEQTLAHASAMLDTIHRQVTVAVSAGLAIPADSLEVEAKRSELLRQQVRLTSGIRLARQALAQSMGIAVTDLLPLTPVTQDRCGTILDPTQITYTEEGLLALRTQAAVLQRRMALADALPHIAVGANYGYSNLDANILRNGVGGFNGALFVTVNVPLTGWWETAHKLREHSLAIQDARLQQQDLTEKLQLKKQQTYDRWQDAVAMVQMTEQALRLAAERCRQARVRYQAGQETIAQYLSAQMDELTAQNEYQDAVHQMLICRRRCNQQ